MGFVTDRIKRVLIAHNPVGDQDDPSTADVLAQVALVEDALAELGVPAVRMAAGDARALERLRAAAQAPGNLVFNLMEAPAGAPHLHSDSAGVLELAGIPFTGARPSALWLTTDKIVTRAVLANAGLPVAPGGRLDATDSSVLDRVPPPWILKPASEDASVGLEGNPVFSQRDEALAHAARLAERFPGEAVLVERFLPGRELNVSLLADRSADGDGVEVLPIAEILFEDFPASMPKVVGYEAKWLEDSFACIHTVRSFLDDPADAPLIARARELARQAWSLCGLAGYARIDLRLDEDGTPTILEVNANPCLAPGAGFLAAAEKAGYTPRQVVERILAAAIRCQPAESLPSAAPRKAPHPSVQVRRTVTPADRPPLDELIRETGFFNPEEIDIALELIDDRLANGEASHYSFLVAEADGRVAGYACWGSILGTQASADLYWIVVHPREQGKGVGAALLQAAETWMAAEGRTRVYVETSTRAQYVPTRSFYLACGYDLTAELADFYAPGDGKAIFLKIL
jgi:D-alanine-D-alanine ligase-like ATP-grasp enzyme/GNAT superfamily N-acetyltransferase